MLDYKPGNPATAVKLHPAPPGAATTLLTEWFADPALRGGDYWRQGIFYRLLLAHGPEQPYAVVSVAFDFLRPVQAAGQPPQFVRLAATPTNEATVVTQIWAVDAAIHRYEFNPSCG